MESESLDILNDKKTVSSTNEMVVDIQPELDASSVDVNASSESNTKAAIFLDDAIRAGGFGARDDIGSFLPVASDFTDFEASLRDARDYEDPKEESGRPGLGWAEVKKQK